MILTAPLVLCVWAFLCFLLFGLYAFFIAYVITVVPINVPPLSPPSTQPTLTAIDTPTLLSKGPSYMFFD